MKGLLIKDFKLLKIQKTFFLTLTVIAVLLTFTLQIDTFAISYLTFIGLLFTLSTISYDEFDNGNAFLFSLPITRNTYTLEKYVFGVLSGLGFCILGFIICTLGGIIHENVSFSDWFLTAAMSFPVFLMLLFLMLPFQLKFGSEKSRIGILGLIGILFILGFLIMKLDSHLNLGLIRSLHRLENLGIGGTLLLLYGLSALVFLISYRCSLRIMQKKEF